MNLYSRVEERVHEVATERRATAAVVAVPTTGTEASGWPVVELHGACDARSVEKFEPLLRRRLGPFFCRRHLVVDLGDVSCVDESFLDLVAGLARRFHAERREIVLVRPSGRVRASLARVGLPNVVPVYESLADARRALEGPPRPLIPPPFDVGVVAGG